MTMLRSLLILICMAGSATAADPVPAKVKLQNKQQLDVELMGRDQGVVMMRETGKAAEFGFPAKDFAWVDFRVDLEKLGVNTKLIAQDFAGAGKALGDALLPLYPYIDLPGDLPKLAAQHMRLLIRASQFDDAVTTSYLISRYSKDEPLRRLAQACRALALFEQGKLNSAAPELRQLAPVAGKDEIAGPYFYTLGRMQLLQTNLPAAHLSAATIIARHPRDFEWMPAGLYLSAKCYIADGNFPVAEQIMTEINTAFPKSRWADVASKLDEDIERRRQEIEQAKKAKDQP